MPPLSSQTRCERGQTRFRVHTLFVINQSAHVFFFSPFPVEQYKTDRPLYETTAAHWAVAYAGGTRLSTLRPVNPPQRLATRHPQRIGTIPRPPSLLLSPLPPLFPFPCASLSLGHLPLLFPVSAFLPSSSSSSSSPSWCADIVVRGWVPTYVRRLCSPGQGRLEGGRADQAAHGHGVRRAYVPNCAEQQGTIICASSRDIMSSALLFV